MSAPDYGAAFRLWRVATPGWQAYTHHAFVEGLRTGDLPRAQFLHYLRQDYIFLIHFARAWALAVTKAETLAEMQTAAAIMQALVRDEMPLHLRICAKEGINAAALAATQEAPANLAYTRYVLEAGYSGDFLDLMAALAPCVLGYGEIGARLAGHGGPYAEWIETYAGTEYQALCHDVGALIDDSLVHRLRPDWADLPRFTRLARHFDMATRLEADFWQMGLAGG
ncbi:MULTISPECIES: TenA family protein [unclassified Yoonia]|uniref:TenA family protein n=1 Tax=unclassified Yoonia TaxID=2629118 RepID=UPI002B0023C3|nr:MULTISPECIES: TenA family protein [unclassified Yoonia]